MAMTCMGYFEKCHAKEILSLLNELGGASALLDLAVVPAGVSGVRITFSGSCITYIVQCYCLKYFLVHYSMKPVNIHELSKV